MKKEEEQFVKEKKGFDHVWERLPHISFYQFWITTFPSVSSLMGGFMSIYPVFAQYKPPYRCQNGLDRAELSSNFSFQEISELTTETPFCKGFQPNQLGGCFFCDFSDELIEKCNSSSFSALKSCFGTAAQQNSTWRACDDYEYDRGIRNNVTNFRGEKWETAVTEFTLHCGMEWFDSLSTALGLLGLLGGAFLAGLYSGIFFKYSTIFLYLTIQQGAVQSNISKNMFKLYK
ncbi:unnamed protein product [Oikopleura dioica]|uniref:Uncharacterized protein n=1 Tax=Oikopleura dioica TaxID=34765 RepID=E4Z648_OIKDI|nr:unnamed protein product [Oikopleura dioica]